MLDLQRLNDILSDSACASVIHEMRAAEGAPASVYSRAREGSVDARVRKVSRIAPSSETQRFIAGELMKRMPEIAQHFGVTRNSCDEPQFLRYYPGDFFVPHQDGNTPLLFDNSRHRRISAVIFLNGYSDKPEPDRYSGGLLMLPGKFSEPDFRQGATGAAGSLVAFRAETTHEVTPVTHGERYSIVSWYR